MTYNTVDNQIQKSWNGKLSQKSNDIAKGTYQSEKKKQACAVFPLFFNIQAVCLSGLIIVID